MIYEMTVPVSIRALKNLSAILDKGAAFADAKKVPFEVMLNSRLAVDQFPLTRQIQIACDTAKLGAARLADAVPPKHEDNEKTLAECQARIRSTIQFLESLNKEQFKDAATRKISKKHWDDKWLAGEEYVHTYMLPNFYFHVTTAYAILRHNGVEIGKQDFLGKLPLKS